MKATVNKKGFTLVEVIAVIALIGVLLLFVMPNLTKIFSNSVKKTMQIQEHEIEESGTIFLEDFCRNKLGNNLCPSTLTKNSDRTYSGYISLSTLINEEYIEDVTLQGEDCNGCVIFTNNNPKAYITCKDNSYETETSVNWKSICNIN